MFIQKTHIGINTIEHEYYFAGKYGLKGEIRAKRKKTTPEQMKKQNQINRENRLRRLIAANFYKNDYWVCLKYKKGTRKSIDEAKKDLSKFLRGMRKEYKVRGEQFKFVYRLEVGKLGGLHVHILFNRIWMCDILASKCWAHGSINFTPVYELGGFRRLASYICKPVPDEEQMTFGDVFPDFDKYADDNELKQIVKYSTSRNLVRPEPVVKKYSRLTMRKKIQEGPVPRQGYYIDKNSIVVGVNQYTGYSYMHYTEIRIKQKERIVKPPDGVIGNMKTA